MSDTKVKVCKHCSSEWTTRHNCPAIIEIVPRKLALELYNSGYQKGHHDTIEGEFRDDRQGVDSEYFHGDDVSEIIKEYKKEVSS